VSLTYGAMFAGYGGLELGVQSVLGGRTLWHAEFEKAPSAILAHHYPDVPNLGDVTKVDWASVPKVDVITGGSPCQDLSHAGKRKGMTDGTRSNLWAEMREAVAVIRPRLVVWENVRGALSAPADSALEPCPGCVGGGDDGPVLRALGRVLGDLAELGYDARWYGLRAADVGAAHGRFRVFLFAQPADAERSGLEGLADQAGTTQAERHGHPVAGAGGSDVEHVPDQLRLLPTPTTVEGTGPGSHGTGGDNLRTVVDQLLPTPSAADGSGGRRNSEGHQSTLPGTVHERLLPTPTTTQRGTDANLDTREGARANLHNTVAEHAQDWREYEAAIRRQERAFGHPAPLPTEPGAKGQPRLSPKFVEWLMGLPEGHVTDPAIGISRNDQLKALGNGVVPQQCAAALRAFLNDTSQERAA
jgi:DNA (cytosine-5)-methyltransferase 1